MSSHGPATGGRSEDGDAPQSTWLYDHIGRIAGIVLGVIFLAFLGFLAVAGFHPALYLLVLVIAFFGMIALGAQIGGRR